MLSEDHLKSALQQYIDGFKERDADRIIALFADDATIEDPVGGGKIVSGMPAISEMYRGGVNVVTDMALSAPIRGSHSNSAAMAFDFELEFGGNRIRTSAIDVMEFNDDGKIVRMRAYWGPSDSRPL